ncbi:cobalt/nickel ABC transporter ATP-binding protein [Gracilibacillus halophilus YIM-C55.5]|uniref:Cobalt/nickel ABC transporter ATP-binding protein n=1 Tax=Gracilibacillus halophilus YIM-C55.5 TaxID=1308866 RepID=N4WL02_9BACI|nr:energy-coupling factor transporter ATPase [Gracilibacillus halophilus]ENH96852.1 cobalt/nickel ABC transporter ATP-binding protein [Gracilibacillus halophilus YIM-C55.5]
MEPMIHVNDVTFQYPGAHHPVLQNVSLTVEKGEFLAILGGNGSGKSTLCKLFNGLIPNYYVGDITGEVKVNGLDTFTHSVASLSEHVGYVYQDFENQIVSPRVLEDASFAPLHYGYSDYQERAERALEFVGLEAYSHSFVWQLSGGQKHLLALASVLSLQPEVIVIDEPVAQLDPQHANDIYHILRKIHDQWEKTIIVIEHHTEFVAQYADQVVLLEDGQVSFKKPVTDALNQVGTLLKHQIYPPQVTQAAAQLGFDAPLPITLAEGESVFRPSLHTTFDDSSIEMPMNKEPLIQFQNVNFSYQTITRKKKQVLYDVHLQIYKGDYVALVGNNGAGKSSLMRLVTGLHKPGSGEVSVNGYNVEHTSPEHLAEMVTYIHQNPEQMFIDDSVEKDVGFYMRARKIENDQELVNRLLDQFELQDLADRDSRLLSGGQQRKTSLAIGVGMDPAIMLLDEPTANLDIATRKHITRLLDQLKEQLSSVIMATHDMQLATAFANRFIVMNQGEVIYDGDRAGLFQNPVLMQKAGLVPPQIYSLSHQLGWTSPVYTVEDFVAMYRKKEGADGVYA